jgi:hypothetical protein
MIGLTRQGRRIQMSDDKDDPIKEMMGKLLEKRDAAIESHNVLRGSSGFVNASRRSEKLVADYALGLHAVSLMSTARRSSLKGG